MNLKERINVLSQLGDRLRGGDEYLQAVMHRTLYNNAWFTIENQERAVQGIASQFLQQDKLEAWAAKYAIADEPSGKSVALIMAGNIPLVGFHDVVCTFVAGHISKIKLSDKDKYLLPCLLKFLKEIDPATEGFFEIMEQLQGFDAVIATGSNNSARYFEAYFGKYPHIIRKNRNAVAVLDGTENAEELLLLGKDIFRFFGLGCRNVSKVYLPKGYDFNLLMERLREYRDIEMHSKYKNNFDYNLSLVILNQMLHVNNGCIILTEDDAIASRIAMLHYAFYEDINVVEKDLENRQEEIQCVVAKDGLLRVPTVSFGKAQQPTLNDYPDGVDVMDFLTNNPEFCNNKQLSTIN